MPSRVRTVAYTFAIAVVVALACSAAAGALDQPRDGWIVFSTAAPEAGGQIISAPLGAGRQRILIRSLFSAPALALLPDGTIVAFWLEGGVAPRSGW